MGMKLEVCYRIHIGYPNVMQVFLPLSAKNGSAKNGNDSGERKRKTEAQLEEVPSKRAKKIVEDVEDDDIVCID